MLKNMEEDATSMLNLKVSGLLHNHRQGLNADHYEITECHSNIAFEVQKSFGDHDLVQDILSVLECFPSLDNIP